MRPVARQRVGRGLGRRAPPRDGAHHGRDGCARAAAAIGGCSSGGGGGSRGAGGRSRLLIFAAFSGGNRRSRDVSMARHIFRIAGERARLLLSFAAPGSAAFCTDEPRPFALWGGGEDNRIACLTQIFILHSVPYSGHRGALASTSSSVALSPSRLPSPNAPVLQPTWARVRPQTLHTTTTPPPQTPCAFRRSPSPRGRAPCTHTKSPAALPRRSARGASLRAPRSPGRRVRATSAHSSNKAVSPQTRKCTATRATLASTPAAA
jgi:hypothetical protein